MITLFELQEIIDSQQQRLKRIGYGMLRSIPISAIATTHALIISGIRRCGKSTLLRQLIQRDSKNIVYLNFEDPRLAAFEFSDFERLGKYAENNGINHFYLDEIQNIPHWENFVRFKLDEGYNVTLTGSNASLLSKELGTKLTGRHITKELFPFSYLEYIEFTNQENTTDSLQKYMLTGGFPEFIRSENEEILSQVFNDILLRDIAVRHQLKQTQTIRSLAVYIISNSGNRMSANALRKQFEIASTSTINEYLNYLQDSYLFLSVNKFAYSLKVQQVNPKKWYAIDTGLITVNSRSFTPDYGRLLETLVYLQLRRNYTEIFYFAEKKECDFIVFKNSKIQVALQVCYEINATNKHREIEGLTEAMNFFQLTTGYIITFDQQDNMTDAGKTIEIIPFGKWVKEII
jgi:predicted AAA+ superfamily ATPase